MRWHNPGLSIIIQNSNVAAAKPEIVKFFKKITIQGVVSPLTDELSMKFQRRYLDFGSSFSLGQIGILCNLTGSGKIQDGGLKTSIACISAFRQGNQEDITEIPTAKPTFLRSSIPLGLMGILCDRTGSRKIQDGARQTLSARFSAPPQDIDQIPTATPMFWDPGFQRDQFRYFATKAEAGNPRQRPQNFKCMYLRFQTRYQRNSNGYAYVFEVQHSTGTCGNDVRPNRKWEAQSVLQMRDYLTCSPVITPI